MNLKKLFCLAVFASANPVMAASNIDPARGGPVTTMQTNPVTYPYVSWELNANAIATIRYFNNFYTPNTGAPGNIELVKNPAVGGVRNVFRMTVRNTDSKVAGANRTEVAAKHEYVTQGLRWYAISFLIPSDWVKDNTEAVVAQIHTSQKQTTLTPPFNISISGDYINLFASSNHRNMIDSPNLVPGAEVATKLNSSHQNIKLEKFVPNKWYCFVIKANWSHTLGKGDLDVYMNNSLVFHQDNTINSYETWLGNYPKTGIYQPGTMSVAKRTIYQDFTFLGNAEATYSEMYNKTPCVTK